jgi:hypothetical protein
LVNYLLYFFSLFIFFDILLFYGIGDWGLGIGDLIGDWGLGPIPNPQSPIPNPQSPIPINKIIFKLIIYGK